MTKNSNVNTPFFRRYIGIDYSGAQTPTSSLKGLRVYMADHDNIPVELQPPPSPRTYWTRRGVAEWLLEILQEGCHHEEATQNRGQYLHNFTDAECHHLRANAIITGTYRFKLQKRNRRK